jgi:hypothetical protein
VRRSETFTIPIASCLQGTILAPSPAGLPTAGSVAHGHQTFWLSAPATACRSLGGHGSAVTAVTAVIVGIRIARAVTAVTIVPAVTAVTRRAFVTRPRGAWAAVGAVIAVTFVPAVTAVTGRAFVTRPGGEWGTAGAVIAMIAAGAPPSVSPWPAGWP